MARTAHPNKEIESALRHAEAEGWRIKVGGSHAWGKIYCPSIGKLRNEQCRCGEFCIASIWSTPRNPYNHASAIRRVVDRCALRQQQGPDEPEME